jgi:hypothetical protein
MSTTARHHQTATARQMPLPLREPPFDDERGDGQGRPVEGVATSSTPVTQGSLALAHVLPGGVAALMPTQGRRASTRPAEPADARRWSARLAQGIAEALAGHRPVQQLVRWTDESVYEMLTHRLTGRVPPAGPRPRVRSIRISRPRDGVVEATAVVDTAGRYRALALRLEAGHGHWRCTALDIV